MDTDPRSLRGEAHAILERLRRLDSSAHDGGTLRAADIESIADDVARLQDRLLGMMREERVAPDVRAELKAAASCLREAHGLVRRLLSELGAG
jgi:hypothetical protein